MADKRIERSIKSIIALRNLLKEVCEKPELFSNDKLLRDALKSQGDLSKFTNTELGISSTSINTLKRLCAEVIDGGFKALDDLRKGALERIEEHEHREKASNKRTRTGLVKRVDELEKDILLLKQSNYLLDQALYEVISDIKSVANIEDGAARDRRSQEAIRKLLALMSVRHITHVLDPDHSNVIHLNRKV
ncbi:hypothetical protein [Ferrovum sp.]|uniref:hypothetical protein n=1 Tax=Ferrovum sp. TaxID=2609467 RepID=UPI0026183F77|nr:hypothetical protein [Ferrovum sp.]